MRRTSALTLALTATALTAAVLPAAADIEIRGEARLGLGYNISNDGEPTYKDSKTRTVTREETVLVPVVDPETGVVTVREERQLVSRDVVTELGATDDLRAVSRIRFGVVMTGESDSGISYGASIRADNAPSGGTGPSARTGQTAGEVFVSGAWGTLTFGDTDGADYARVGDPIGNATLTGLGDYNELPFLSNGGGSDNDELQFLANPETRPTVRYDYDYQGFGLSLSTDRTLDSVGVGGSYEHAFSDMASVKLGAGYYDFSAFEGELNYYGAVDVPDGDEWAASLTGSYGAWQGGIGYASIDAGDLGQLDVMSLGAGATFGAWTAMAYYSNVVSGDALFGEAYDGNDSFGASLAYDLGGGAQVKMGVARTYGADAVGDPGDAQYVPGAEAITLADFGINMTF